MRPFIFLCLFLYGTNISVSQALDYNQKKGVAINGYDVVAYFNNTATKGSSKYATKYDGVIYKFISNAHLNLFEKNPKKYLPQYGGYCAYAIATKAKKVSINPETYLIKNNRLYLFYNAWGTNTLKIWNQEAPDNLKKKADNH